MAESFDPQHRAEFDQYAESYDAMHAASIAASGEGAEYFALYKLRVLERLLGAGFDRPGLDFGCGIGNLTRLLARSFPVVHGYDPSSKSAEIARKRAPAATFFDDADALPRNHYGFVVLANVLHHVPPGGRRRIMDAIVPVLAEGGRLVVFEHNPLNPVTRRAVAICPFDADAELLYPWQVTRLLRHARLTNVQRRYIVFFPRLLRFARPLEPHMGWLSLGAQVCAWGTKASGLGAR
jgi:SAM-dependent methyltransferase